MTQHPQDTARRLCTEIERIVSDMMVECGPGYRLAHDMLKLHLKGLGALAQGADTPSPAAGAADGDLADRCRVALACVPESQFKQQLARLFADLQKATPAKVVTDEMVTRFLGWGLPKDFYPDCGISFDGRKDDEWNKTKTWPIGTNLLTADQARQMLEHVLATPPASEPAPKADVALGLVRLLNEARRPSDTEVGNVELAVRIMRYIERTLATHPAAPAAPAVAEPTAEA